MKRKQNCNLMRAEMLFRKAVIFNRNDFSHNGSRNSNDVHA